MRTPVGETPRGNERSRRDTSRSIVIALYPGGSSIQALPPGSSVTVGRDKQRCNLVIDHPSVSRAHATLHAGPPIVVEDLGSTNGTRVDGLRVASGREHEVARGDVVDVGSCVLLVGLPDERDAVPARRADVTERHGVDLGLVVEDERMVEIHRLIELVAKTFLPVVLVGEPGVGKKTLAEAIHLRSSRAQGSFVVVSSGFVTEAELFGYERGAFPGAAATRAGLLEEASSGTLFLRDVDRLSPAVQARLADTISRRTLVRLGSVTPIAVDVRVVASTTRDPAILVAEGALSAALAERLCAVRVVVPPLRARPREVEALARHLAAKACTATGRPELTLSDEALALLRRHAFPGNLPELESAMQRAVELTNGSTIRVAHLFPLGSLDEASTLAASRRVEGEAAEDLRTDDDLRHAARRAAASVERQRIAEAMEACGGNQTKAAEMLGISRRTLVTRLGEYGFPRPRQKTTTRD